MTVLLLMQHSVGPLESLNSNLSYDLVDKMNLALGTDSDSNPYIDNPLNTKFFDIHNVNKYCGGLDKALFLSLNIRSLMCNLDDLSNLLANLSLNSTNIFAIALQEVWNVPYPELAAIDG